jgi:aminopeptidase N
VQKLFQKQSHRDLEWFFDDWVYRDRGLPDFRVASAYSRQILSGTYMVTVTVENLGSAGAEVPIRLRFEGGDVSSKVEVRGKSSASVRVEVPSPAREVTLNDGSVPESDMENNTFGIQESRK